jgi:tRNA pseudouridine38-40 synthase
MVRIIAGTLVEVGVRKITGAEMKNIIESKNRNMAGKTLPPNALYLVGVQYE